jgi:hypothetical protein
MAERDQTGANERPDELKAQPQGDGADTAAEGVDEGEAGAGRGDPVGRVGASDRGGQGGYGNDTGFAGGTTGSREGERVGKGESSQAPAGRSNDGGMR